LTCEPIWEIEDVALEQDRTKGGGDRPSGHPGELGTGVVRDVDEYAVGSTLSLPTAIDSERMF
jgi:hypothetical protein